MRSRYYVFLVILLLIPSYTNTGSAQSELLPSSLAIEGIIADNYANISYTLVFDNQNSDADRLTIYRIRKPNGLFLSNVSVEMGNLTFWGRVSPIDKAKHEFNESVSVNKSAVLVTANRDFYDFEINVKAGVIMKLKVFFEGYLTRKMGFYDLDLYKFNGNSINLDLSISLSITSSLANVQKIRTPGFTGVSAFSIATGKQIIFTRDNFSLNSDLGLSYSLDVLNFGGELLTYSNGTDNFFLYLLAPEINNISRREPREFIFVIDVSGSMGGGRLDQAKEAFSNMIESLDSDDLFNVISFESKVNQMWGEPKVANLENIEEAIFEVNGLVASGSTNFNGAVVIATVSFVGDRTVKAVVVLSDGAPTVGETDTDTIRDNVRQNNVDEAIIFSVAFGSATDEGLMASIAFDSSGLFTVIEPGENSVEKLGIFYDQFATPIALGFSIDYTNAILGSVLPSPNSLSGALFNGSEILQTGRFENQLTISTNIFFSTANQTYSNLVNSADSSSPHIERIWAHNTINQLLKIAFVDGVTPELRQKIVTLALNYGFVVPEYTGLIIVVDKDSQDTEEPTDEKIDYGAIDNYAPADMQQSTQTHYETGEVAGIGKKAEDTQGVDLPGYLFICTIPVILIWTLIRIQTKKRDEQHIHDR